MIGPEPDRRELAIFGDDTITIRSWPTGDAITIDLADTLAGAPLTLRGTDRLELTRAGTADTTVGALVTLQGDQAPTT